MIVQNKPTWLYLVFSWRGSVMRTIWKRVLAMTVVATAVTAVYELQPGEPEAIFTLIPFSLIAVSLGIFLSFRNNTSYDRYWEGRKLWGGFVNTSRTLARQILTFLSAPTPSEQPEVAHAQRALVYMTIAYIHAVRLHLREQVADALPRELAPFLPEERLAGLVGSSNAPIALLLDMGQALQEARMKGWLDRYHAPLLEGSLVALTDLQGGCERIKKTPVPFSYTVLMHRIVGVYCLALPFGIVHEVGYLTPLVVLLISYTFMGLDGIGDEIEDPFGEDLNDLPLSTLSRMIEINLREALGEVDLPPMLQPDQDQVLR
jgi:putative membrane protein